MPATNDFGDFFSQQALQELFPPQRTEQFFEALFGGAEEGAYDIELVYKGQQYQQLRFELHLKQRPGKCLACNLTSGLPTVFERHPIINIKGLVADVSRRIYGQEKQLNWELGRTKQHSSALHVIPLAISLN